MVNLRDRKVVCSASDRQVLNFESCVCRAVSSHSSYYPQEVFLAQFSLYVHKSGLKPDSFPFCTLFELIYNKPMSGLGVHYFVMFVITQRIIVTQISIINK